MLLKKMVMTQKKVCGLIMAFLVVSLGVAQAETPQVEAHQAETPQVEAPQAETSRVEAPQAETSRVETPQVEISERVSELLLFQAIPISISSMAEEETMFNSVSTVTVIDKSMIERYGFASVSEALESMAGFMVWRTYQKKGLATSRGILQENYANKVLVMINGVQTWHAGTGEGELDRVSISQIERIEVLKGPASVLYGSNAYTGAVNLVLKKAKQKSTAEIVGGVGNGRGAYNGMITSSRSEGLYAEKMGDLSLLLSASAVNDIGQEYSFLDEGTAPLPRQRVNLNEVFSTRNLTLKADYLEHSLMLNAASHEETCFGNNISVATGLGKLQTVEGFLLNYTYSPVWKGVNLKYALTYDWDYRNLNRASDSDIHSMILGSRLVNQLEANYQFWDALNVELGADYDIRVSHAYNTYRVSSGIVSSENGMAQKSIREGSVFGQAMYSWEMLKVLLGTRYTQNEQFGSNVSSRGTVVCTLDKNNSLKFIAGQSYRAPSLFETNFVVTSTVFGNPDLKPEKSNSLEVAYLTSLDMAGYGNLFLQMLGYYATYENNIFRAKEDVVYNGVTYPNRSIYRNAERFSAQGAEVELKYSLKDTQVYVNADVIKGDDGDKIVSNGYETYNFKYIPQFTVSGGIYQNIGPVYISGNVNYYPEMNGPFEKIPAGYWLSATVGYKTGLFTHSLTLKNVTDQDISVPEYVRRSVLGGVPRVNEVPLLRGQRIDYAFKVEF